MSGIAGIIRFDGGPVEPGLIEKMTGAMAYRGPDGIDHWVRGSVALGQCMLHTTTELLEETQPLANEDESVVLVMDGWLSNWVELRDELLAKGAKLRTRADSELVLRAYETWGPDCAAHLDGDFAILIWDARRREVFCARDRTSKKPLCYHWDGRTLVVASDLPVVLAYPGVPQEYNEGRIAEILALRWHSRDETIWRDVKRLVAAHRMRVSATGLRTEPYWTPPLDLRLPCKTDADYIAYYRDVFADCVRRCSRSHRPVAYEVSGGHDSSAIFGMAEHLRRDGQLPAPSIAGYTLNFEGNAAADEIAYARAVGTYWGVEINEILPTHFPLPWFKDCAAREKDFPGFPNSTTGIGLLNAAASAGSRVILNGEGGDEFVGGRQLYYAEELAEGDWRGLADSFKADVADQGVAPALNALIKHGLFHQLPASAKAKLRRLLRRKDPHAQFDAYWLSPRLAALLEVRRKQYGQSLDMPVRREGQRALLLGLRDSFNAFGSEQSERMGATAGLDVRVPMYARAYIEMAMALPERLRLRGNTSKYIHLQALAEQLPPALRHRRDKAEFSVAFEQHIDGLKAILTEEIPAN